MSDREYTPAELALLNLYAELLKLSDDTTVGGRIILLAPDGTFVATGTLAPRDIEAMTIALTSLNEAKAATEESTRPEPLPVPSVEVDRALEAELEEYCIGLDADFLMQLAEEDPNSAVAAFDEATADWDGEL